MVPSPAPSTTIYLRANGDIEITPAAGRNVILAGGTLDAARKTDGSKRATVSVPKLDDAEWAGTARSAQCTLILTEGDSAKASAVAGLLH